MKRSGAFSLVEVMCSIAILGIAVFGLTQGMTTALRSSKDNELVTVAALYASGKIETLRAEGDIRDGQTDGDCGDALPLYRWKQTVSRTGLDGLHEVTVEIDQARTGDSIYELKTMVFEEPTEQSQRGESDRRKDGSRSRRREGNR